MTQAKSTNLIYYFKDNIGKLISSNVFTRNPNPKRIGRIANLRHGERVSELTSFSIVQATK